MRNLLNPRWLFVVNTLPITVLTFVLLGDYRVIKTQLSPESIGLWRDLGLALALLAAINIAYAIFLIAKGKTVSFWYGAFALLSYIGFLWAYNVYNEDLIPRNIPLWMLSGDAFVYVGTFLMPTLAYALFVLVARITPDPESGNAGKNFGFALLVPLVFYLFAQLVLPWWHRVTNDYYDHFLVVMLVAGTVVFLFLLIRAAYILVSKRAGGWQTHQLPWKIVLSVVFPL